MNAQSTISQIEASVRIPGTWESPVELRERLPDGYRLSTEGLHAPDGSTYEIFLHPPDGMFPDIFARSCVVPPRKFELRQVKQYQVNFCLAAPAGNRPSVLRLIDAVASILEAGGAGVFVDNSGVACGASAWQELAQDRGQDTPLPAALCNLVASERGLFSVGMHLFGSRDVLLLQSDNEAADACRMGHLLETLAADPTALNDPSSLDSPELQGLRVKTDRKRPLQPQGHPMYNPFGRWLVQPA